LVIKKGKLRWFGHAERKDDSDWIKCCTTMEPEVDERDAQESHGWMMLERMWKDLDCLMRMYWNETNGEGK